MRRLYHRFLKLGKINDKTVVAEYSNYCTQMNPMVTVRVGGKLCWMSIGNRLPDRILVKDVNNYPLEAEKAEWLERTKKIIRERNL